MSLVRRARDAWTQATTQTSESQFQRQVLKELLAMGLTCCMEGLTRDRLFSVDVMVRGEAGQDIAVEVDGPSHFTSRQPYRELGSTLLRRRLVAARVSQVVCVPFFEWDSSHDRQAYLRGKLQRPEE